MSNVRNQIHLGVVAAFKNERIGLRDEIVVRTVDDEHWRILRSIQQRTPRELLYCRHEVRGGRLTLALVAAMGTLSHSKMLSENLSGVPAQPTSASVGATPRNSSGAVAAGPPQVERNPERNVYFGETHQHTSWSFDAYIFGNHITGPADSYKYWKGETIKHPLGHDIKIDTPLDWGGVTDHSEYSGVVRLSNDPSSPLSKMPIAQKLIVRQPSDIQKSISGWAKA
jgi:hypothetical protein